jgi:hypothetical protein
MAEGRRGYVSSGENTPASERYSKASGESMFNKALMQALFAHVFSGIVPCVPQHELMGQGACKRVYRGFDEVLGIEVAWNEVPIAQDGKCDAQQKERIFKEINLLSQLKHKNILALQDWWLDKETSTCGWAQLRGGTAVEVLLSIPGSAFGQVQGYPLELPHH